MPMPDGFEFHIMIAVHGREPVLLKGTFPDFVVLLGEPRSPDEAQQVIRVLSLALDEARLSLAVRQKPPG